MPKARRGGGLLCSTHDCEVRSTKGAVVGTTLHKQGCALTGALRRRHVCSCMLLAELYNFREEREQASVVMPKRVLEQARSPLASMVNVSVPAMGLMSQLANPDEATGAAPHSLLAISTAPGVHRWPAAATSR